VTNPLSASASLKSVKVTKPFRQTNNCGTLAWSELHRHGELVLRYAHHGDFDCDRCVRHASVRYLNNERRRSRALYAKHAGALSIALAAFNRYQCNSPSLRTAGEYSRS
jgi:hypothetical protein